MKSLIRQIKGTTLLLILQQLITSNINVKCSLITSFPSLDLISTSLVMLEAAIPAPHTLVELQQKRDKDLQKDLVLVDNKVDETVQANIEGQSTGTTEQSRLKQIKKNKKTTLTIVQDFPKKQAEQQGATNINLVQGHANINDVHVEPSSDDKSNKTTLTIVQEFPKKNKFENQAGNIEMVQGQEQNTNVHFENPKGKQTTLTIVQDFPKKKDSQPATNNVEMVQGKNTEGNIHIIDDNKNNRITTLSIVQEFPKKKDSSQQGDGPVTQDLVQANIKNAKK